MKKKYILNTILIASTLCYQIIYSVDPQAIEREINIERQDSILVNQDQTATLNEESYVLMRSILNWSITQNFFDIVNFMSSINNIGINTRDSEGMTPLMVAANVAELEDDRIFILLISRGSSILSQNSINNNWTPLHYAADRGHLMLIRSAYILYSIEGNINFDIRDIFNMTPLMVAASRGHSEVVDFLLSNEANPFYQDINRWTALHHAVNNGDIDTVETIINHETGINSMYLLDNAGRTPLDLALDNHAEFDTLEEVERGDSCWLGIIDLLSKKEELNRVKGDFVEKKELTRKNDDDDSSDDDQADETNKNLPSSEKTKTSYKRKRISEDSKSGSKRHKNHTTAVHASLISAYISLTLK